MMKKLFGSDEVLEGLESVGESMPLIKPACEELRVAEWDSLVGFNAGVAAVAAIKNSLQAVTDSLRPCSHTPHSQILVLPDLIRGTSLCRLTR